MNPFLHLSDPAAALAVHASMASLGRVHLMAHWNAPTGYVRPTHPTRIPSGAVKAHAELADHLLDLMDDEISCNELASRAGITPEKARSMINGLIRRKLAVNRRPRGLPGIYARAV